MHTSKQIVIAGYFGYGSAGDEAALASVRAALFSAAEPFRIVAISGEPPETEAAHGLEACDWSDGVAMSEIVRHSEAVVIAGSSLFDPQAATVITPGLIASQPAFMTPAVLAAIHQKPIVLYAIGLDGPVPENMRPGLRAACEAAVLITTRDPITRDMLAALGVPASKITVTADPAWMLAPRTRPAMVSLPKPVLGILHAAEEFPIPEAELAAVLDRFVEETGGSIVFAQLRTWRRRDEPSGMARLRPLMARQTFSIESRSLEGLLEQLAGCDAILADHIHGAVFGLLARKPVLAVACSPGLLELRNQGLDGAIVDGCMLGARQLLPKLRDLCTHSASSETIDIAVQHLCQRAKMNGALLLDALEGRTACGPVRIAELIAAGFGCAQKAASADAPTPSARRLLARNRELTQKNQDLAQELKRRVSELASVNERDRQDEIGAARLESDLAVLTEDNSSFRNRIERLERQVENAELLRRETIDAAANFQAKLDADLRLFRRQRAWKVMLYIRKAYTIVAGSIRVRSFPSLSSLLALVFAPGKNLDYYELPFPVLQHTLPSALQNAFEVAPARAEAVPVARPAVVPAAAPVGAKTRRLRCDAPPQTKYDVLILPVFEFDFRCQRPQHLATQFARAGHRVFYISPSRTSSRDQPYETVILQPRLYEIRLRAALPNIYLGELRPEHVKEARDCLEALYRDFAIAESCSVVLLPFWRRLGIALRDAFNTKLLYDCMDDWQTMPDLSAFNRREESQLAAEADVLVVTGRGLWERQHAAGHDPVLVRNGTDFELFSSAHCRGYLEGTRRPIVGYYGAIADWFDYDLLIEVAQSRPDYSFVLIGGFGLEEKPKHDGALRLMDLPNVHLLGHKPYPEMPAYLTEFDVCMIPFVLNEVTKATDPVKLYEYLSQGKPVVATPMRELYEYQELIYIAATPAEFASALDVALAERDSGPRQRRIDFAAGQGWSERWRTLDEAIRTAFPLVSILILTHNSEEYIRLCLEALLRCTSYPNYEVILVDNASQDRTVELAEEFASRDSRLRIIRNQQNLGFAAGNNQAAEASLGEYLILLNIDTIPTPGWVQRLMRHSAKHSDVGLVVPVTNSIGNEAKIHVSYRDLTEMESFAVSIAAERLGQSLDLTVGPLFCAFLPRAIWNQVGALDERFKVGMFEDDDFSLRIRKAGFRVVTAEDCFIHHFGGGSFSKLPPADYQEVFATNKRLFEEKWRITWTPHQYRSGITADEGRFCASGFATGALVSVSAGD